MKEGLGCTKSATSFLDDTGLPETTDLVDGYDDRAAELGHAWVLVGAADSPSVDKSVPLAITLRPTRHETEHPCSEPSSGRSPSFPTECSWIELPRRTS